MTLHKQALHITKGTNDSMKTCTRLIIFVLLLLLPSPSMADTLYVSQQSNAADTNPGTSALPFKTLAKMNEMIKTRNDANTPVIMMIGPGRYRENISLLTTGTETTAAITIQAATAGTVTVSGSDVWTGWTKEKHSSAYTHAWSYNWGLAPYPSQYWIDNVFLAPIVRRREMIFVNGVALDQVLSLSALRPGAFFVDETADIVSLIPPPGAVMETAIIEVAVRSGICKIESKSNLTVRGLIFTHDNSPVGEVGAAVIIDTLTNALLEDNQFVWNNWTGLSIFNLIGPTLRRNVASYNGAVGLDGWKVKTLLMEDNDTSYNNWRGVKGGFTGWTAGGMKHLLTHGVTVRRHRSTNNSTMGIWFDTDCTDVVLEDSFAEKNLTGGIFLEALQGPVTITDTAFCRNGGAGVLVANVANVTFTGNVLYGNLGSQIEISGEYDGTRDFNNWETAAAVAVKSENWTFTGNKNVGLESGSKGISTTISPTKWGEFVSTLTSNTNTWFNPQATSFFGVDNAAVLDFAGWKTATGEDTNSTFVDLQPPCDP